MLVLNRKRGERIIITTPHGEIIKIEVVESGYYRTKLGFEASSNITIDREEVDERKQHAPRS